jgi:Chaperone of endosialidase
MRVRGRARECLYLCVMPVRHVVSFVGNANHGVPIRLAKLGGFWQSSVAMKTPTRPSRHSMNHAACQVALLLIPLALICFAVSPRAQAVCQEGCLTNFNTVLGDNALLNNVGFNNTAIGFNALENNTGGLDNTATGRGALNGNTTGSNNTATGYQALHDNNTGSGNTATGVQALQRNNANSNTANGGSALKNNTTGALNTAIGASSLSSNTTGFFNTAIGSEALSANIAGSNNVAIGAFALKLTIGSNNIAVGLNAGLSVRSGSDNIDIGNNGADESGTIRIGTSGTQTNTYVAGISGATVPTGVAVIVDTSGHLGTTTSSGRFKQSIKPMDKASEVILALHPVTFRYKKELDPVGIQQFGLVAEEVEKVNPDLVARDADGKVYTVRYDAVNAMLLNEFLKEHKKVEQLEATVSKLQAQGEEIAELKAVLKQQAAQLQKVSARLEANTPATRLVDNP